ncbi:DNA ligase 1-like [Cotesia glomerata]|uniref:ZSWIM3 N-terminal domain-containing protein n=1 Tax=Cotesia glomerata TaxID=32391 RepID=A0AAV7IUX6_COTGL|nr:DNA ligase 1-like [Cotesia glomerata]KAH0559189.1 hypothetical protein KQX54_001286 [Cotesia glomerata]
MVENFQVGKEYPADQLQFHKDLDAYEQQTKHKFFSYDTRTMSAVQKRYSKKMENSSWQLYEANFRCIRGKKKHSPQDKNVKYCPVELIIRMNSERNAFVVKKWKHQHNHGLSKIKERKKSWEEKFMERMSEKKKERTGKKKKKTLEESIVDEYLKVLSEYIINNPNNLQEKLNLIKLSGEKIAEIDGKKDQIIFPRVDSSGDEEENLSGTENEESTNEEEEIEVNVTENITAPGKQNNSEAEKLTRRDKKKNEEGKKEEKKRKHKQIKEVSISKKKELQEKNKRQKKEKEKDENKENQTINERMETIFNGENKEDTPNKTDESITAPVEQNYNKGEWIEKKKEEKNEKKKKLTVPEEEPIAEIKKVRDEDIEAKKRAKETGQNDNLSNAEIMYHENTKSDLSVTENQITVENLVQILIKEEVWKEWKKGYVIKLEDLKEINDEIKNYLRENVIVAEELEKMVTTEVLQSIYYAIHNGAV